MIELALALHSADIAKDCTLDGAPLYGRVEIVEHFADFKVKVVDHFADLHVKTVEHFPDACGEWRIVDSAPDFTVTFVDYFPDFTISFVDHFPGLP